MAVSPYFKHVTSTNEQSLLDSLTRETIFQRGLDLLYIPRRNSEDGFDYLFGEDPENVFSEGIELEFWCENVESGYDGGDMIGRFGLEMPDRATFICSKTRFEEEIKKKYPDIIRPREGDLIVFKTSPLEPMDVFEIMLTEKETPFYQLGRSNVFRIDVERYSYSHETIDSGLEDIDNDYKPNMKEFTDSPEIQDEADTFVNFSEKDPFSDGEY